MLITPELLKEASWRVSRGTILRVQAPVGHYWRGKLAEPDALYVGRDDLVFTACHFDEQLHAGDYYSEFDEPMVEEIRLLGALGLSIGPDGGAVTFYPHPWSLRLPAFLNLSLPHAECELRSLILSSGMSRDYESPTDPPLPRALGGPAYGFREARMPRGLQRRILRGIEIRDHLLIRGLAAWLKGAMLGCHQMFVLEALYSLYVSLDASHSLVRRRLREEGVKNPSAEDAAEFLARSEGREAGGQGYFSDFYAERVSSLHPESRFGIFPYAPVKNCDAHCLMEDLREVFRLLILGKIVDPQNHPRVVCRGENTA